jgi:hypothetical protein
MGNQNERTLKERFTRQRREGITIQEIAWILGYPTAPELYQALAQEADESGIPRDFMFRTGSNQSASSDSAKRATSKAANDRLYGLCESTNKTMKGLYDGITQFASILSETV